MNSIDELVAAALKEDQWMQDVTTAAVLRTLKANNISGNQLVDFVLVAKDTGVFSGANWAQALVQHCKVDLQSLAVEGEVLKKGQTLMKARAPWADVLAFERTLLNGLQYLSGIATQTRSYVQAVDHAAAAKNIKSVPGVYHTRKTMPLMRELSVQAVLSGGGQLHRKTLSDRVLSKENHKYVLKSLGLGFSEYLQELKRGDLLAQALIEVENLAEARELLALGVCHLMLDNFSPAQVAEALQVIPRSVSVEISGGLNLQSIPEYVQEGVTRLSIGALTHSVKALDISLDWAL